MDKKYYQIDENSARIAKNMMSFDEYEAGSKTREYQGYVDKAWDLAEETAKARPSEADRVYWLADRYAKKLADNMNRDSVIGTRCPSVMISGAGNFPTRKKEKQIAAWDRNREEWNEIHKILDKIEAIKYGKEVIKSGDPAALEKLEAKLEDAQALQEKMKAANKAIRMKDTDAGDDELRELGFTNDQITDLRKGDFCGRIGFPGYMLSNNNAEIHRLQGRIKTLQRVKEQGDSEEDNGICKVVRDTTDMRIRLIFDSKPDSDVRDILKGNGFKWSPKNMAWQRQLNNSGEYAAKRVIEKLKEMQ